MRTFCEARSIGWTSAILQFSKGEPFDYTESRLFGVPKTAGLHSPGVARKQQNRHYGPGKPRPESRGAGGAGTDQHFEGRTPHVVAVRRDDLDVIDSAFEDDMTRAKSLAELKRAILSTYGLVRLTGRADEYLGLAIDLAS